MNINKEHAITLLAQGVSTSQVAAAIGCDDSYISQLKADPDVQQQIAELGAKQTLDDVTFDSTLERAEMLALEKIEKNLPFATLGQAMAAFRTLNGARRRKDGVPTGGDSVTVNVNLTLPANAMPRYITNAQSEIIEVDGKTMLSATPKTIDDILAARNAGKSTSLPTVTAVEKAAARLGSLAPMAPQRARRAPIELSLDVI